MPFKLAKPYYGWYIVCLAFISLFVAQGTAGFVFGIFLPFMSQELGWSQSTIVIASSIASITSALVGPPLGRIADKNGPRAILLISLVVMFAGLAGSGLVQEPWHFYLTFGVLTGVARFGLNSMFPSTIISSWFIRRRSAAYGAASLGPPVSNLFIPVAMAVVVEAYGWRAGWLILGLQGFIIGIVPALLIRRQKPEEIGLLPDGERIRVSTEHAERHPVHAARSDDWTAAEAIRSPAFWAVASGMALVLLGPQVAILFMFSYLVSIGVTPTTAALIVSVVSGIQAIARIFFWAPLSIRLSSVRWLLVVWGSLMFIGTVVLGIAQSETGALVASVILGIALGGNLVLQLQVWPEYFGRVALGTIIGWGSIMQGITAAVFPWLLAVMLDQTGNYLLLYLITAGLIFLGLALHAIVGKPRRPIRVESRPSTTS